MKKSNAFKIQNILQNTTPSVLLKEVCLKLHQKRVTRESKLCSTISYKTSLSTLHVFNSI